MNYKLIILIICIFCSMLTNAQQQTLTLQQAIEEGLKNNFSILVSQTSLKIAENNNSLGNAGFLPTVMASGSYTNNNNSTKLEYANRPDSSFTNSKSTSLLSGVELNWTVFNGFEMFIEKSKLEQLEKQGETYLRSSVENILSEIRVTYYGIVLQERRLKILHHTLDFSVRRSEIAYKRFKLGNASELFYLQSLVDLNTDSAAFLQQQSVLQTAKAQLNVLLARLPEKDFMVEDSIPPVSNLSYSDLVANTINSSAIINLAQQNLELAMLNMRLSKSPVYPRVNFFAGYNYSQSHYEMGVLQTGRTLNPNFGVNFSFNLFNGFNNQRNIQNAKWQKQSQAYEVKMVTDETLGRIYSLFNEYQANQLLINLHLNNSAIARKNSISAIEQYKLGAINDLELRQIQLNELQAEDALLSALYNSQKLECELLRISGKLSK